jgi:Peptidase C13 family
MMRDLTNLGCNLGAGFRLAMFVPVSRLAFRIDLAQLLLLFVASALIDVATDWIRFGPDATFSWFGAGGELIAAGLLLLTAALQALVFRKRSLALAIPVLALASFPVIQVAHTAPYLPLLADVWPLAWLSDAFDMLMGVWSFAAFVRVVAIALTPARPHLWPRAVLGALMLAVPIVLAPSLAPTEPWWRSLSSPVDGRYPNPASEPVLVAQQTLLDDALTALDDETPGQTDLYFVGFAGDARDANYARDVQAAQKVMDERWNTQDRSLALVNSPATLLDTPMATVTNLRETLKEVAAAINPDEDVVMLYFAGPADREGTLGVAMPPLELVPLAASTLRGLLDDAGIVWRIIVVSSCRADGFVEALMSDTTLVIAAAGDDATGGCARTGGITKLGGALFHDALPGADSLRAAFEAAQAGAGGATTATPGAQLFIGPAMAEKLKELDRGRATRGAGRTI